MALSISAKRRSGLPRYLALIGDSTFYQDGNGATNLVAKFVANGWDPAKIFFYACIGKAIAYTDANGYLTTANMTQARTALGREPDVWYFNLGSNGDHDDTGGGIAATQATWINSILNNVATAGPARVYWNGISQQNGYDSGGADTEATRLYWNSVAQPVVQARTFSFWSDWHTYVKAYPGEDALWSGGVHMTPTGYNVKNTFTSTRVGPGGN